MSIDLLGGSVEIFVEKNGKLQTLAENLKLQAGMNFVESVKVSIGLLRLVQIEVVLVPPIDQAIQLLRSGILGLSFSLSRGTTSTTSATNSETAAPMGNISVFMNKLVVKLNYGGTSSNYYKGLLLQPDIQIGPSGITITLKAVGMMFETTRIYTGQTKSWTGKENTADILKDLFGNQVILTYSNAAKKALSTPYERPLNTTNNNFDNIKDILEQNNCTFYSIGSTENNTQESVKIITVNEQRQRCSATFVCYRQIKPSERVFPMLDFSAPIQNLMLPYGPWNSFNIGHIPSKTKKIEIPIDISKTYAEHASKVASSDGTTGGGAVQAQTTGTGDAAGISQANQAQRLMHTPARDVKNSLIEQFKGYVHAFTDRVFEYNVTAIGVMDLLPGTMVKIQISDIKEMEGDYDVVSVEHQISISGAETKMQLQRTGGLITALSQGLERAKAKAATAATGNTVSSTTSGVITQ